jgi:hypothetical protein
MSTKKQYRTQKKRNQDATPYKNPLNMKSRRKQKEKEKGKRKRKKKKGKTASVCSDTLGRARAARIRSALAIRVCHYTHKS